MDLGPQGYKVYMDVYIGVSGPHGPKAIWGRYEGHKGNDVYIAQGLYEGHIGLFEGDMGLTRGPYGPFLGGFGGPYIGLHEGDIDHIDVHKRAI